MSLAGAFALGLPEGEEPGPIGRTNKPKASAPRQAPWPLVSQPSYPLASPLRNQLRGDRQRDDVACAPPKARIGSGVYGESLLDCR